MTHFVLHIFPESSLASSLITTVWIGIFVTCFFNLRFGWNKSGLIIPGYLVPLLILKPWSAVAVIIEGLVTYLIVKFVSEFGSFSKFWNNYFGRDRFFLLFIVAVAVRILFDEMLFPHITIVLEQNFNIDFVYKGGLYSIGLVIVALTANHFWNSGLKRGFPHLIIILLCTYIIIQFILIPYTNFRLNDIIYLYEDIATSIAASPKAYIILTVTAFCASRMNLLYGWEFSGIIIPALLALQWYFPWKIASSIIEAGIIYGIAILVLRSRFFINSTIEGARKILLFFNIAFIYKIILGFTLPLLIPDVSVTDTFGLGYMLTSLIAIKMYDKKIGLKMTRSILQVSVISIIFATFIGFILLMIPSFKSGNNILDFKKIKNTEAKINISYSDESLLTVISKMQVTLYGNEGYNYESSDADLDYFQTALLAVKYYKHTKSESSLKYALKNLIKVYFDMKIIQNKYVLLYEKSWKKARGIYAISLNENASETVFSVPYPICNPALLTSVVNVFQNSDVQALAISNGLEKNPGDVFKKDNSFFYEFLKFFSRKNDIITFIENNDLSALKSDLKLDHYKSYIISPSKEVENKLNPVLKNLFKHDNFIIDENLFKHYINLNYGSLVTVSNDYLLSYLSSLDKYKNLASNNVKNVLEPFDNIFNTKKPENKSMFSYLTNIFSKTKGKKKIKYSKMNLSNQQADFLDKNIVTPLTQISLTDSSNATTKDILSKIKFIDFAANDIGFSLNLYTQSSGKPEYIVLSKNSKSENKMISGAYLFKTTKSDPYLLEVFDLNNPLSLKFANILSKALNPSVLMFAISPLIDMNLTELADLSVPTRSIFNLVNQIAIREFDAEYKIQHKKNSKIPPPHTIQIRILKDNEDFKYPENTIYISTYLGKYKYEQLSKEEQYIYNYLKKFGFNLKFIDGSDPETAGLEAIRLEQSKYLTSTQNSCFMVLWFSPNFNISDKKNIEKETVKSKSEKITDPEKTEKQNNNSNKQLIKTDSDNNQQLKNKKEKRK